MKLIYLILIFRMLYKKIRILTFENAIVDLKRRKLDSKTAYCCKNDKVCKYFEISSDKIYHACTNLHLIRSGKISTKLAHITSLYHICSYINYRKSIYFYAPEKVIPI